MVKDISVLHHSYIPERLPGRDEELLELSKFLKFSDQVGKNIMLYGKSGTGKTATTDKICRMRIKQLTEKNKDHNAGYFYVNCMNYDTKFKALKEICNQMSNGSTLPNTYDEIQRKFMGFINKYHTVLIFLDEIDAMVKRGDDELKLLYTLSRIKEQGKTDCNISMIIATNRIDFYNLLEDRIKSSLGSKSLIYSPYDSEILGQILLDRANIALNPGFLNGETIRLCSAYAAQDYGDARKAINLLRTAVELADFENSKKITTAHVKKARAQLESDQIKQQIQKLPLQCKLITFAACVDIQRLVHIEKKHITQTGSVYDRYLDICHECHIDSVTQRRASDILTELDSIGVLNAVEKSLGRYGRSKIISLTNPLKLYIKILSQDPDLGFYLEKINNHKMKPLEVFSA